MDIKDDSRRGGSQSQRPQTANSKSSQESSRSHGNQYARTEAQRDRNINPHNTSNGTNDSQNQSGHFNSVSASVRNGQPEHTSAQSHSSNDLRSCHKPQQANHVTQTCRRYEDNQMIPSHSQDSVSSVPPQGSNTVLIDLSEASASSHIPPKRPDPTPQQNFNQQPKLPNGVRNFALPYQATSSSSLRSTGHDRFHSNDLHLDRYHQGPLQNSALGYGPLISQGSYDGDHYAYFSTSYADAQSVGKEHLITPYSPPDEDIPDFDAAIGKREGTSEAIIASQNLYYRPQMDSVSNESPPSAVRSRTEGRGQVSNFAGLAYRSRSQPNLRDVRPAKTVHNLGFNFDSNGYLPAVPPINHTSSNRQVHELDAHDRENTDISSRHGAQPNPLESQVNPLHSENSYKSTRVLTHGYGPESNHDAQDRCTYNSPSSLGSNQRQARTTSTELIPPTRFDINSPPPMQDNRMYLDQRRSPGTNLGPSSVQGTTSPTVNYHQNPDALPEHPTPVRHGLVQTSNPIQTPKPAPLRQYDNDSLPSQKPGLSQLPVNLSSPKQTEKPAQVTHEELDRLRQVVRANPNDQKTQLMLAKKMVEAASVLADDGGRADQKQRNKNREKYVLDAHKLIRKLANRGYTEAMFYLADCHGRGLLGLQADPKEAFNLYLSAAKSAHPQSAYRVAVCCELGQEEGGGTRRDPLKAIQWYKRAATLGDTPAMYKMGMIRLKGLLGQPKYPKEALVWLKRAADRADEENPHALHELVRAIPATSIHIVTVM